MVQSISTQINSLCRRPVLEQVFGKSRSTIDRDVKRGLLTKPVKIGTTSVAWPENEIKAISDALIAGKSLDEIRALVIELEAARGA